MWLTGWWSTLQSNLTKEQKESALPLKKKMSLSSLVDTIKNKQADLRAFQYTPWVQWAKREFKSIVTDPKRLLKETSKNIWAVWGKIEELWQKSQDIWKQKWWLTWLTWNLLWSWTRAAWWVFSNIENTRKKIKDIGEQVKTWKITKADWIIQWVTTGGLTTLWTLASSVLIPVNSVLNATWVDKDIEKADKVVRTWTENLLIDKLGLSPEKAASRTDSVFNLIRWAFILRGGRTISWKSSWRASTIWQKPSATTKPRTTKQKLSDYVQGSLEMTIPDFATLVLAKAFQEEWKELPKTNDIKDALTLSAVSLFWPIKWGKWKTTAPTKWKTTDITQLLKKNPDTILEIKPEYTDKQVKQIQSHNKWVNKRTKNTVTELNELQQTKREWKTQEFFWDKETQLDLKKLLIEKGKEQWTMKDWWTDKWLDSTLYTDKWLEAWGKWVWVHTPKETKTTTSLTDIIEGKIKKSLLDYYWKDEYNDLTARLNIAAQRFKKKGWWDLKSVISDKAKWWANLVLDALKKAKDLTSSTIWGYLDSVVTTNKARVKQTLWDLVWWVRWRLTQVADSISKTLKIKDIDNIINKNTKAIDSWFNYVKKLNLKEMIPWNDVVSRMRRFFIEKMRDNNELYSKKLWEKQASANKVSVLAQYVWWEIAARIAKLKQEQIDIINKRDLSNEAKQTLIDDISLSPDVISKIQSDVIAQMPKESQWFLNAYFDQYWQFKQDTILKDSFGEIAWELNQKWFLEGIELDYSHWYVPDIVFRKYIQLTGDTLGLSWTELSAFLKNNRPLTPEQRSSILKNSKDIWFLHSQDPLSIAHSYVNKTTELIQNKMLDDLIDSVSSKSQDVANYLKGLKDENSKMYNDIRQISKPKSIVGRALDKYLNASAYWLYIANPTLIWQNAFTSSIFWLWKAISNILTWEWSYTKDVFSLKNRQPTAELLFNKWLLAHRDVDANIWFKWDATTLNKVARNTKKYIWEQPMQKSTALWVKTIQVITANAYMKKFVWDDIKPWESIASAYKRKIDTLSPQDKLKAETELYRQVSSIENPTTLNKATSSLFDYRLFWMVTAWARWNSSYIISKTMNTVDTIHNNIKAALWKKWYTKIKDGKVVDEMTMVTTKLALAYTAAKVLWELLYDDDDARRDEIKRRLNAETFADNVKYFFSHSMWIAWAKIWWRNMSYLTDFWVKMMDAYDNNDPETAKEAIWEFTNRWFSWIKKVKDIVKWDERQLTQSWEFKYQDEYSNETLWDIIWRAFWLSKPAAEYNQTYQALDKLKKELQKQSKWYTAWGTMFDNLNRHLKTLPISSDSIQNTRFRIKVDRLNRNIKDLNTEKIWFDDWIKKVYEWIADDSEVKESAEWKLKEKYVKNASENYKVIAKLKNVLEEINTIKSVKVFEWDFPSTLNSLKETHPKLYNKFMKQLYSTVSWSAISDKANEQNNRFIDNVISADLWWEMLSTNIAALVQEVTGLDMQLKKETWKITNAYDELSSLNKVLWVLENAPMLQEQIFSSLSELIPINITWDNAQAIYDGIKDFPIIHDLFIRAAELRWAILKWAEEAWIKQEESNNITPKEDLKTLSTMNPSWNFNTKWTTKWTPIISSERKANWNLIDLINLKPQRPTEPTLKRVWLQTLLDKIK